MQYDLPWELVNSLNKNTDKRRKLKEVANTGKIQNQETKISLYWNNEWKPTTSNARQINVNSSTEVGKAVISGAGGEIRLNSGAFTRGSVFISALDAHVVFKALHALAFTFLSSLISNDIFYQPTVFTQVMGWQIFSSM